MKFKLKSPLLLVAIWLAAWPALAMADESAAAQSEFEATLLDGTTTVGQLTSLTDSTATLQAPAGERQLALKDILTLVRTKPAAPADSPPAPIQLGLADGSLIFGMAITADKQTATLELPNRTKLEVPVRQVRSVRFSDNEKAQPQIEAAWQGFTEGNAASDVLVIRKNGMLDSIEGVVGGITVEAVEFSLDGDSLDVKLPRVAGVIFARTAAQQTEAPRAIVHLTDGSRWNLSAWKSADRSLQMTSAAGISWIAPVASIDKFDFSAGKLVYLSDLVPQTSDYRPFFAPDEELSALRAAYLPRGDVGIDGSPLVIDGRTFRKGLAMYSKGTLVYRLPEKLNTFSAVVGIADRARAAGGNVALTIRGDDKVLWQGDVRAGDASVPLELAITGVKRLELLADFGSGQDVGDHLILGDAKVTK